tara:strand:+ start:627 stop:2531 length:1905 start_codon:yes stop_codon:yes gene_type:complete
VSYESEFERARGDAEAFWMDQAAAIAWRKKPAGAQSTDDNGVTRWFADGELNTAELCLDRHVDEGRGDQVALIYDSPVTRTKATFTYLELRDEVARVAGGLAALGVGKGDRVVIYLPMVPEAAISMLACARLGAIHSVVFGGFAARELATRIDDAQPRVVICATCGIEFDRVIPYKPLVDEALSMASHTVEHCVVLQRPQHPAPLGDRDVDWGAMLAAAVPAEPVTVTGSDPLYILYTSGTTGKPKGVVRDNGGHAVALHYSMGAIYGAEPGDVYWAASDVGWVVGHSYIVYAPLLYGCTTILFEGKPVRTPDAGTFWRVISEYGVRIFFTAPTAFRAIRKEDPQANLIGDYDLSSLEMLFVAGERTDPPTYHWLEETLKVPVIDHWWQTETGWPMAANPMGIEAHSTKAGSASFPVPGYDIRILGPDGDELPAGTEGDVAVRLPLPPGTLPTVWGDHARYDRSYMQAHPGYYQTGDGGFIDKNGYLFIMGRTDDVINVAGHRLSTGEMEEIVAGHPAVAECAVIGIEDAEKGQIPLALALLKDGVNVPAEALQSELVALVRRDIGAFANFKRVLVVPRLPKTRSGKILRQVMRKIADAQPYDPPATIDDPVILDEIADAMRSGNVGLISTSGA